MKNYDQLLSDLSQLLERSRRSAVRAVNSVITATYWELGCQIVEFDQKGAHRASYGKGVLKRLSQDLTARFGKGFSEDNLELFRAFYLKYPAEHFHGRLSGKSETVSRKLNTQTLLLCLAHNEIHII